MLLLCKIENPLFYTFTKDSRFYIVKARKCPQKRLQIFTRHELIEYFFLKLLTSNPSPAIGILSLVYGKIAQTSTGERFRALFRSSKIFVNKNFRDRVVTYLWERGIGLRIAGAAHV